MRNYASIKPADTSIHGFADALIARYWRHDVVELHHDVRSNRILYLHRPLRRQRKLLSINVRLKRYTFRSDFAQFAKAEDLESATVGEDRSIPRHKFVKSTHLPDQRRPGPKI